MPCEECKWRAQAVGKPNSILARLWRWHTGWCPGWRRYQAQLAAHTPVADPGGQGKVPAERPLV